MLKWIPEFCTGGWKGMGNGFPILKGPQPGPAGPDPVRRVWNSQLSADLVPHQIGEPKHFNTSARHTHPDTQQTCTEKGQYTFILIV